MPFVYDPLRFIERYNPVFRPMDTPGINSPDEYPTRCIRVSEKLIPYLLGLIEKYTWIDAWRGTEEQVNQAVGVFNDLRILLTEGSPCEDCLPDQSCVSYAPSHPYFEFSPGEINGVENPPAGYLRHPWFTGDKLTVPGFTFNATDVLCNLNSVASSGLGIIDQITQSGLPRFRFTFEGGPGTVQLHLLTVEFGGLAIIRLDESEKVQTVNLQSVGFADLAPSTEWILTLLGLVTDGINGTTIVEIDIPDFGTHTIDVLMSPYVEFPNVLASGWGGGIRKITVCGQDVDCEKQVCSDCGDCSDCQDCGDSDCEDCSDCAEDCDECEECE